MSKLQGQSTSCPNSIAQHAAIEALIGDQKSVIEMRETFIKRRDLIVSRLNDIPGISCNLPGGAFYVFPNISDYLGCSFKDITVNLGSDFSMILLEEESVVSVAGDSFGASDHIRLSYAVSDIDINIAIDRLESLLKKLN